MFPEHHVGMWLCGLPRSAAVSSQSSVGTGNPSEVDDALTVDPPPAARTSNTITPIDASHPAEEIPP
ncbi:hypothetical protein Asi03nite_11150 [Actinoplanes siamensis]|uniref:Uncharacterized protein n=1 Tax=Actinoplanes siamensis TaxID=1223317 RepID=A0A919THK6_9ACTN|nr:hypothetical protein Asi03nite_11150 [Actinoplanes siamensis]